MKIRKATLDDAKGISDIYNYYVENTVITFETTAVSELETRQRIKSFLDDGFPYYVGELDGKIIGYCHLHNWNNRSAYSFTKEMTIYLDKGQRGRGLGTILYQHLFKEIYKSDIHAVIAGICIPNDNSVRLHEKFGLKQVSKMDEIGWKFDQWCNIGHWQLIINQIPPKILILCPDNGFRSQVAHGFLQSFDPKILVYSAGMHASRKINSKAIEVMQDVGIDISHHTCDNAKLYINERWDYVITICNNINEKRPVFSGKMKTHLHIECDDPSKATGDPKLIQSEYFRVRDYIKTKIYELYTNQIKSYE